MSFRRKDYALPFDGDDGDKEVVLTLNRRETLFVMDALAGFDEPPDAPWADVYQKIGAQFFAQESEPAS